MMTGITIGTTTVGDWTMWGSLTLLGVLGLVAVLSDWWYRKHGRET